MPVCGEAVDHNFPSAFNGGTNFIMTTLHCLIGGMDSMGHYYLPYKIEYFNEIWLVSN